MRRTGSSSPGRSGPRSNTLVIVGLASLANGIALLAHIFLGFPLPLLLAVTWTVALLTIAAFTLTGDPYGRGAVGWVVAIGLVAGIVATLTYDVTKFVLSQLDPSPYNPFEATRIFGQLLIGETAPPAVVQVAGWTFHLVNGTTFGIAFACLFGRFGRGSLRIGLLGGIAWGLILETFQLAIYPGWLNVRFLDEFRQISFLSHIAFGAVLGTIVPRWLGRSTSASRGRRGG